MDINSINSKVSRIAAEADIYNGGMLAQNSILTKDTTLKQRYLYKYDSTNSPTFFLPKQNITAGGKIVLIQLVGGTNQAILSSGDDSVTINGSTTYLIGGYNTDLITLWYIGNNAWIIE